MRAWLVVGALGFVAAGCEKGPTPPPPQAPAAPEVAPLVEAAPSATASASPAPAVPESGYPECGGQRLAAASLPPRAGAVSVQLAPAFLDELPVCKAEDVAPKDVIARAGAGTIDSKGDCVFASIGVSCHYHSGSEFVTTDTKSQVAGQGELHCIFPSDDPKSPRVFGAHVVCSDPARQKPASS